MQRGWEYFSSKIRRGSEIESENVSYWPTIHLKVVLKHLLQFFRSCRACRSLHRGYLSCHRTQKWFSGWSLEKGKRRKTLHEPSYLLSLQNGLLEPKKSTISFGTDSFENEEVDLRSVSEILFHKAFYSTAHDDNTRRKNFCMQKLWLQECQQKYSKKTYFFSHCQSRMPDMQTAGFVAERSHDDTPAKNSM